MSDIVRKNIIAWFFLYLDFIWIKIFGIDYVWHQKSSMSVFDINISQPIHLYTNKRILTIHLYAKVNKLVMKLICANILPSLHQDSNVYNYY